MTEGSNQVYKNETEIYDIFKASIVEDNSTVSISAGTYVLVSTFAFPQSVGDKKYSVNCQIEVTALGGVADLAGFQIEYTIDGGAPVIINDGSIYCGLVGEKPTFHLQGTFNVPSRGLVEVKLRMLAGPGLTYDKIRSSCILQN
jgi:hypothetical protein